MILRADSIELALLISLVCVWKIRKNNQNSSEGFMFYCL